LLSTTTINQVRDLPIEQVIDKYVTLKRSGGSWKACCPLHNENSPSFYVTPSKNIFKCFGCGAGGDAIGFVMLRENLPFIEAVKHIAGQHGIIVEEKEGTGKTPEQKNDETLMHDWLHKAQIKYRKALVDRASVINYLSSRNFTRSTIIEWQFGVVPDWSVIGPDLQASGQFKIGETAGLVKSGNGKSWDVMHHRITIPIHDARGQVIGFGGRLHAELDVKKSVDGPKYMNPAETPLYDKSKTLFGLHKAIKHFKVHGMAVLVEGYLDVIKMHQQGWNNAVGSCGTALTEGQAKQLKRFTDTVLVLRDGDNAGRQALKKDIPILLDQQFTVYVCELPEKEDPDTLFDKPFEYITNVLIRYVDGIEYLCNQHFADAAGNISQTSKAIESTAELLSRLSSQVRRDQYIDHIGKRWKVKVGDIRKAISTAIQKREDERLAIQLTVEDEHAGLPAWVDRKRMEVDGFVQLTNHTSGYKAGIYFLNVKNRNLYCVTNFTIKPLYHIFEQSNNRRLIEVDNTHRSSVVELPTQATVNQGSFEAELMNRGNFMCFEYMTRSEFKRMIGWMVSNMPIAFELKTLGWQPEGFFAYSNAVFHDGNLLQYDELGMLKVEDKHYMSLGNSKIHRDERQIDNPYENDLFLKHVSPREGMTFEKWSTLFNTAYGPNGPYGIAFTFLTLFKDIVTRIAKMPLLYCYGQKGSGKSEMAESILRLFFSGKDAEGNLMRGFNLNPGQSTPFSFNNRNERFRNCPILYNEFDENTIEPWKTGSMKAAYDGEGREVGEGTTGKAKKTRIQKVNGTIVLVGQYLATKDDAAVSSRSIPCNFSLERLKNLSPEAINCHNQLKDEEHKGLCFLLTDLLKLRPEVQRLLSKNFMEVQAYVMDLMRKEGYRIEARLISNYSIMLAATKVITELGIKLPYTYPEFFAQAMDRMIKHNQTLKDNSIVGQFWKSVEVLFDMGLIKSGEQISIQNFPAGIDIKEGSKVHKVEGARGELLLMRFSNVYSLYAKYHRERTGQAAQGEETLLMYLKEQTYFIGLSPYITFSDKRTSGYAFNYEAMKDMGIVLEKNPIQSQDKKPIEPAVGSDDIPF